MEALAAGERDVFHRELVVLTVCQQPQGVGPGPFEGFRAERGPVDVEDDVGGEENAVRDRRSLAPPEGLGREPAAGGIIHIGGPVPDEPSLQGGGIADAVADLQEPPLREDDTEVPVGYIGDGGKVRQVVLVKEPEGIGHFVT